MMKKFPPIEKILEVSKKINEMMENGTIKTITNE